MRRPHECSVSIEILNLPEFNLPWHRRGPLSLLLFWLILTAGAFTSLCLSKRPAEPLPGILSAQPEASNVHPKRSHSPVTQTYITDVLRRAGAAPGPAWFFYQLEPIMFHTCRETTAGPFMSYAHVIFAFCPPQVHQQEHHPQNPRVDDHSHRASSRVSVRVFVMRCDARKYTLPSSVP